MVVPHGAVVPMRHMKQRLHGAPRHRNVSSEGTSAPRGTCGRRFCFGGPGPSPAPRIWSPVSILVRLENAPIEPTNTQDELKAICERNGGSWYGDDLVGGFCERRGDRARTTAR